MGSLIIKQKLNYSDRETISVIAENSYLQYFIGLKEFQQSAPFEVSSMVEFRKTISDEMINIILENETSDEDIHDDNDDNIPKNEGTILRYVTCTPADITYSQDLNFLNFAREKLE